MHIRKNVTTRSFWVLVLSSIPIGKVAAQDRSNHCAKAEKHPVLRSGIQSLPKTPRNEVDKKDHVRNETEGCEGIFRVKHSQTRHGLYRFPRN